MFKQAAIKIVGLVSLVAVLNVIYNFTLFRKDLNDKCEQAVEMRDKQSATDIYYFAESSNFSAKESDSLKESISEITNLFFPKLKITAVNKAATHAGIYCQWLNQFDLNTRKPKALVVTLNLRSFDAAWIHSRLETPLQESVALLRPYPNLINRFLLSLNAFDDKTEKQREQLMLAEWQNNEISFPQPFKYKTVRQWDDGMAQGGFVKPDGSWDMEKITLACHYIKGYAFNIHDDNPRVKDFDQIAAWCQKNGIPLYLNLMAENIQYADSLVGKELVFLMKQNRDYLVKRYTTNHCTVVDNLELVEGLEFTDQTWTTEHYGYKGRMVIAKNLASKLKDQFNNHYKKAY